MKTIARTIILVFFCSLLHNCSSAQINGNSSPELFVQFKELFHEIDLPINWNCLDIGKLSMPSWGPKGIYYEIPSDFFSFLPDELLESDSITYIRALFQLPPKNGVLLFVIATDYQYDRYRTGVLYTILTQIYLLGYDSSGKLLFNKFIAGNHVDKWDKLLTFNSDYKFETRYYEFLGGTMTHPTKKHLVGLRKHTKTTCEITKEGIVNCSSNTIIGYFEYSHGDYELVKIYEDN